MKKGLSLFAGIFGILAFAPQFAFAQTNVGGVLGIILNIINVIITILIIAAIAYFIYTVVFYVIGKGEKGKIWNGLIGLFIIVTFWGIIRIVQNTFGLNNNQLQNQDVPCVQGINC